MSFTPSSGQISASQIREAFGITGALSFGSRRSTSFWRPDAFLGTLPANTIRMSDFYNMRAASPVTPSTTYYSASNGTTQGATVTQSFTVPLYYQMDVGCRAAGGGGGGGAGAVFTFQGQFAGVNNGSAGASGGSTSFGSLASAVGGGGGGGGLTSGTPTAGATGAGGGDKVAFGGAGGGRGWASVSDGAAGGAGGFTSTILLSPVNGGSGPAPGTVIPITVGAGGGGGGGGGNGGAGSPGRYGEMIIYVS